MAHSRTAQKNIRKSARRRVQNKAANSAMRTAIKKVRQSIEAKDKATAEALLPEAQKLLDKAAKTHRVHANRAARLKSQLARAVRAL